VGHETDKRTKTLSIPPNTVIPTETRHAALAPVARTSGATTPNLNDRAVTDRSPAQKGISGPHGRGLKCRPDIVRRSVLGLKIVLDYRLSPPATVRTTSFRIKFDRVV